MFNINLNFTSSRYNKRAPQVHPHCLHQDQHKNVAPSGAVLKSAVFRLEQKVHIVL